MTTAEQTADAAPKLTLLQRVEAAYSAAAGSWETASWTHELTEDAGRPDRVGKAAGITYDADDDSMCSALYGARRAAALEHNSTVTTRHGTTIQRKESVVQRADKGYKMSEADRRAALAEAFTEPVIVAAGAWKLPAGAFGDSCGPT